MLKQLSAVIYYIASSIYSSGGLSIATIIMVKVLSCVMDLKPHRLLSLRNGSEGLQTYLSVFSSMSKINKKELNHIILYKILYI